MSAPQNAPHRRFNPLTGEWVLVSPHRTQRPWQGQMEAVAVPAGLAHDPTCYLCAGNTRMGGQRNPDYVDTFVFDNDFAALTPTAPAARNDDRGLLVSEGEPGICRVVCFSPRHDLTLARMSVAEIARVVEVWVDQTRNLGADPAIGAVQIFENRGEMMGCSNPHPHGQIWASHSLPNELAKETEHQAAWHATHDDCLLCAYLARELALGERIVHQNADFVVLVPFWAVWPFETMVLSRRHAASLTDLDAAERESLAEALSALTIRYDNLFQTSFPYSMGFHQAPTDGAAHPEWHLHGHFYPPLLRSATVKKFMVGFELLGSPQRDITAEAAAARLREMPAVHYLDR
ncbi:UDP-glucose--hexose-1-phosphate uridylyltransferase [Siculibacillus lacustris]|uniref:Galactose-1-phosphate uridylyltransferase n=1 Tax=Siculibacillus lacustris TaxID=1549641 RepID=A0A4Q9VUN2_9HYPH|nr:UDP-glucose--hexose-1-phosphate uridylyltransferase [Siculibacillus lacustris]TBW38738.1 UDP-glucose--hexose-1-phosphate uridylyltransferase [Siculibacillus lacustris]